MKSEDIPEFAKITAGLMANFGAIVTEMVLDMWFDMATADGITIEQWKQAAMKIIRDRKYTSQPTYADFYEIVMGKNVSESDIAENQVTVIMSQIRSVGYYGRPVFEDPITKWLMSERWSFHSLCSMTEKELSWWAKEFKEAYHSANCGLKNLIEHEPESMERKNCKDVRILISNIGSC